MITNINIRTVYTDPVYDEDGNETTPAEFSHYEYLRHGALPRSAKYPDNRTVSGFNLDAFPWSERNQCEWYQGEVIGWNVDDLTESRLDNPGIQIVDGYATVTFSKEDKPLEDCKNNALSHISQAMDTSINFRPPVEVDIGGTIVTLQGGLYDILMLERGKKRGKTKIKDIDNVLHTINPSDWDSIITQLENAGDAAWEAKNTIEQAVRDASTPQEVRNVYIA